MSIKTITPHDLYKHMQLGHKVILWDVRTPSEYEEVHIMGSELVPLETLDPETLLRKIKAIYPTLPTIYITCASGTRAEGACKHLVAAGYEYLVQLEGGTTAWEAAGLPVERKKMKPNLVQQMQMITGGIVTLGTLLGTFVNTGFLAIPLLVGAGLIYAGFTQQCYLMELLKTVSWNQEN